MRISWCFLSSSQRRRLSGNFSSPSLGLILTTGGWASGRNQYLCTITSTLDCYGLLLRLLTSYFFRERKMASSGRWWTPTLIAMQLAICLQCSVSLCDSMCSSNMIMMLTSISLWPLGRQTTSQTITLFSYISTLHNMFRHSGPGHMLSLTEQN